MECPYSLFRRLTLVVGGVWVLGVIQNDMARRCSFPCFLPTGGTIPSLEPSNDDGLDVPDESTLDCCTLTGSRFWNRGEPCIRYIIERPYILFLRLVMGGVLVLGVIQNETARRCAVPVLPTGGTIPSLEPSKADGVDVAAESILLCFKLTVLWFWNRCTMLCNILWPSFSHLALAILRFSCKSSIFSLRKIRGCSYVFSATKFSSNFSVGNVGTREVWHPTFRKVVQHKNLRNF